MAFPIPNLDDRRFEDLLREARERIPALCLDWTDFNPSDPGITLVELMAWLTDTTLYRLNRIPNRSYAIFLDLMGVRRRPAEAAHTWLLFTPKAAPRGTAAPPLLVERGTAVQARRDAGPPLVFSSFAPLNLTETRPALVAFTEGDCAVIPPDPDPAADFFRRTLQSGRPMALVAGLGPAPQLLFLGRRGGDPAAALPPGCRLQLEVVLAGEAPAGASIEWEYPLADAGAAADPLHGLWRPWLAEADGTDGFRRSGRISFVVQPAPPPRTHAGGSIPLRGRLLRPLVQPLPALARLGWRFELPDAAAVSAERLCHRSPLQAITEQPPPRPGPAPVEAIPFGAEPGPEAALLVGSPLFGRPGAEFAVRFTLRAAAPVVAGPPPELRWEMFGADGSWFSLGRSTPDGAADAPEASAGRPRFIDGTAALTRSGTVTFTRPAAAARFLAMGELGWFLRIRLLAGQAWPVSITDIRIAFTDPAEPVDLVLAERAGQVMPLDSRLIAGDAPAAFVAPRPEDATPALLIGLTAQPAQEEQRLFLDLAPPLRVPRRAEDPGLRGFFPGPVIRPATEPVRWSYSTGAGWAPLPLREDFTRGLETRGTIAYVAPEDWAAATLPAGRAHWLRASFDAALAPEDRPTLAAVATNCVEAVHAELRRDTLLPAVLDGSPWQRVKLPEAATLPGLILAIREVDEAGEERRAALRAEGAELAPAPEAAGRPSPAWVLWREVPDFFASGPEDRHFVVDHVDGSLGFGDGSHGRIPPRGANRIRLVLSLLGGGRAGNIGAGTIDQLVGTHAGVGRVTNPVAAEGGADAEPVEEALRRGPEALRHRDRAVTAEDYERLACTASLTVARARCVSQDGVVQVLVIPDDPGPMPMPGRELVAIVQDYLDARRTIGTRLRVTGPDYMPVAARLRIALRPSHAARIEAVRDAVRRALETLVHPVRGGPDIVAGAASGGPSGWPLGRALHLSEVYYVVEQVPGVDYADGVALTLMGEEAPAEKITPGPTALPYFWRIEIGQVA